MSDELYKLKVRRGKIFCEITAIRDLKLTVEKAWGSIHPALTKELQYGRAMVDRGSVTEIAEAINFCTAKLEKDRKILEVELTSIIEDIEKLSAKPKETPEQALHRDMGIVSDQFQKLPRSKTNYLGDISELDIKELTESLENHILYWTRQGSCQDITIEYLRELKRRNK